MADGTWMATLVIVFRETLEAGLIVGIVLTVLARLKAWRYSGYVWASVAVAVAASFLVGWVLSVSTESVQGRWETIIEGVISLVACGVLTYMVFWMDKQGKRIKPEIEHKMEDAVSRRELVAIIMLPFLSVFREGAETVLFLKGVAYQSGAAASWLGGLLGAGLAVGVTAAIFVGGRKIQLKALFRSTGVVLLLIAAGLLAYGIHELQELGWIPMIVYPVWDINPILNEKEGFGAFMKALFGYNGNPSLIEVIAYLSYILGISWALRRIGVGMSNPPSSPKGPSGSPSAARRRKPEAMVV